MPFKALDTVVVTTDLPSHGLKRGSAVMSAGSAALISIRDGYRS